VTLLSEVQKTWSFLINLFIYSEEVKKELPTYTKDFVEIDKEMKRLLNFSKSHPNIFEFCTLDYDDTEDYTVLNKIEEISDELAKCQKGLNDFIASKRKVFPRFFFLTMEELLDILANGNNPKLLFKDMNYMNKVVQAANKLQMTESGTDRPTIVSMDSAVGIELVTFVDKGIKLEGKVENYLMDVLNLIIKTLKVKSVEAMDTFVNKGDKRKEWIISTMS